MNKSTRPRALFTPAGQELAKEITRRIQHKYGLSPTKAIILLEILSGKTSEEITQNPVDHVYRSISTIKRHIESIYRLTGIHTSRGICTLLLNELAELERVNERVAGAD